MHVSRATLTSMANERSLFDRMMDFVDYHLGGTVVNRPPRKNREGTDHQVGSFAGDGGGASGSFDDCGGSDGGGGDCGGGDGGGGGGD